MKKSISTSGFKDWSIDEVLDWVRPLGLDGIELWMGHIERYQAEQGPLDRLTEKLERYQLEVPSISGYTTFSGGFSGEKDMQQEFKSMNRLLDVARQLGSPLVRTFLGHVSSRRTSPEQWASSVMNLKKVMNMADQYEVDIAVEVHYDTFADNTESMHMLMKEVDHPRLKIIFDGGNLNVEKVNQLDALAVLYPWVRHIHLKNHKWDHANWYKTQAVPIFEGDLDNRAFLSELKRRDFNGYISLEYFDDHKEKNIIQSLEHLKNL